MKQKKAYTESYPTDDVSTSMKEKYLHSMGANRLAEGKLDEAIELLGMAIDIEDQSYTRHHRGLAYLKKDSIHEAIMDFNRAIELNPDVPEYYRERSRAYRTIGEISLARRDEEKILEIDYNYGRLESIQNGLKSLREALLYPAWVDGLGKNMIRDERLLSVLDDLRKTRDTRQEILENASCLLPCPAYCCHFSRETMLHGVHIGSWKLYAIRAFLQERGFSEDSYLRRIPYRREQHLKELIPPQFIIPEKGERWIYFPARQRGALSKALLKDLPKGQDYQSLVWINEEARPCAFLREGRCMVHDTGGEPGLPSCKDFLCFTGFIFVVLKYLQLADESQTATTTISELNNVAVESLLVLARELWGHESVIAHRSIVDQALSNALDADKLGNEREVGRFMKEYELAMENYEKLQFARKESLKPVIAALFRD